MVQLICALRITFPDVGLVMSTREKPQLRDGLLRLGITLISAGSHTEPGGYTGAGVQALHHTIKGRIEPIKTTDKSAATGQFDIADSRPPHEIASVIQRIGYEPVWKDWDAALTQ
jgi:2-iminoacetate synthase